MPSLAFTEEQLKNALKELAEERYARLPFDGPDPEFSENYQKRKRQFIAMARDFGAAGSRDRKRRRTHRVLKTAAAVLGILIISFAIVMAASPKVYAAVRNWTVNIYNKIVDYTFNHSEDDHAVIICDPAGLPEGFVKAETYHSGYYTRKLYKNAETGDYIRFEYRKPTQAQVDRLEKRGQKAEPVTAANGVPMYYAAGSPNELFWYDADRKLIFSVESNLNRNMLLSSFASVDYRLPLYEPAWLPEGYEGIDKTDYYPNYDITYYNPATDSYIYYSYSDLAETDLITIDQLEEDVIVEDVIINGEQSHYFPSANGNQDGDLVYIFETENIVIILTTDIGIDNCVRFAESIRCTESSW